MFNYFFLLSAFATCVVGANSPQGCSGSSGQEGFHANFYNYQAGSLQGSQDSFFTSGFQHLGRPIGHVERVTNVEIDVHGHPGETSPVYGFPTSVNNFAVELTGHYLAPLSGLYTFRFDEVDDAASFQIGRRSGSNCCADLNSTITDDVTISRHERTLEVYLQQGTYYPVRLAYFNSNGDGNLKFSAHLPNGQIHNGNLQHVYQRAPSSCPSSSSQSASLTSSSLISSSAASSLTSRNSNSASIPTSLQSTDPFFSDSGVATSDGLQSVQPTSMPATSLSASVSLQINPMSPTGYSPTSLDSQDPSSTGAFSGGSLSLPNSAQSDTTNVASSSVLATAISLDPTGLITDSAPVVSSSPTNSAGSSSRNYTAASATTGSLGVTSSNSSNTLVTVTNTIVSVLTECPEKCHGMGPGGSTPTTPITITRYETSIITDCPCTDVSSASSATAANAVPTSGQRPENSCQESQYGNIAHTSASPASEVGSSFSYESPQGANIGTPSAARTSPAKAAASSSSVPVSQSSMPLLTNGSLRNTLTSLSMVVSVFALVL